MFYSLNGNHGVLYVHVSTERVYYLYNVHIQLQGESDPMIRIRETYTPRKALVIQNTKYSYFPIIIGWIKVFS